MPQAHATDENRTRAAGCAQHHQRVSYRRLSGDTSRVAQRLMCTTRMCPRLRQSDDHLPMLLCDPQPCHTSPGAIRSSHPHYVRPPQIVYPVYPFSANFFFLFPTLVAAPIASDLLVADSGRGRARTARPITENCEGGQSRRTAVRCPRLQTEFRRPVTVHWPGLIVISHQYREAIRSRLSASACAGGLRLYA